MPTQEQITFPPFRMDMANEQLWREGRLVPLQAKAFAVLRYLVEHAGRLVTRRELTDAIWPDTVVSEGVLRGYIRTLRDVLGDDAEQPQFIETAARRGYRFVGKVVSSQYPVVSSPPPLTPSSQLATDNWQLTTPLVGREGELALLQRALEKALHGERQVVFVTGESGIGKTTVVGAFLRHVNTPGGVWLGQGQCVEHYGTGEAYLPVLEAMGGIGRAPGGERFVALLSQHAPTWLAQMPALLSTAELEELQRRVAGATRERMLREMVEAVDTLTAERALVLWLEDLHWADYSTLDWLAAVAQRHRPARLLVIGTYRPADVSLSGHPLKAVKQDLQARGRCEEVWLQFLTREQVAQYLVLRYPRHQFPPALGDAIHHRTDGNPLFVVNTVDDLAARGVIAETHERWGLGAPVEEATLGVPESLRQLIERHIERLGDEQQQLLEVASVAGGEFSAATVAASMEATVEQVEEECERLVRRGQFLQSRGPEVLPDETIAGRYRFLHALYQAVLYERLPAVRRMRLHRGVGEWEERRYGNRSGEVAAELAMHFERGGDLPRAVYYRQQAGENALRQYGYREAIEHLQRGLELLAALPETPERIQRELTLQLLLGAPLTATKGYAAPEVETVYARARELCRRVGETPQLFPVLCGLCRFYIVRGDLLTARDISGQLVTLAQATPDPGFLLAAHNLAGVALFYRGELLPSLSSLEQGHGYYDAQSHSPPCSQLFRSVQDPWVTGSVHAAWALWLLGYPDRAATEIRAALTYAHGLSHPLTLAYACHFAAGFYHCRRESHASQEQEEASFALSTEHGLVIFLTLGAMHRGWQLIEQGRIKTGMAQLRQGLAEYRATGGALRQTMFLAMLAEAYGKIGQPEEGLTILAEALAAVNHTGEGFYEAELYRLQGELTLQRETRDWRLETSPPSPQASSLKPLASEEVLREAEGCFLKAIEIARRQQAKLLELRATVSLARLRQQQATQHVSRNTPHVSRPALNEAHKMLSDVYSWFTEGFDTADLKEAKALLDALVP